ncbi:NifB/NifX family molybdenum-iron cluster-binding protein [candidate division WOR-3 bacterium]|nr:NifB/NifX family molybdenum-iron cluster-binding protein [candidate division WOR-3 bacterium]
MIVAVTCAGKSIDSPLDNRFGRAESFILFDLENGSFTFLDNEQNLNAAQGAGIQSAQKIAKSGATALITGHTGPKAFKVLSSAGISVYHSSAKTVKNAIEEFKAGKLEKAPNPDVESHWA